MLNEDIELAPTFVGEIQGYPVEQLNKADVLEEMDNLIKVQCSDGNWNYDPYMHGMANGMILMRSLVSGEDPEFIDAPDEWIRQLSTPKLVEGLSEAMRKDPELAFSWHCNLAMAFYDSLPPAEEVQLEIYAGYANEGASRFMKLLFDVETSRGMLLEKDGEQAFSLRSAEGGSDVSKVAVAMGGGGHEKSAGFISSAPMDFL